MRVSAQGKASRTLVRPLQALKNATLVEGANSAGVKEIVKVFPAQVRELLK